MSDSELKKTDLQKLGVAQSVRELKALLEGLPDGTPFGFRNQPMQVLYKIHYKWDFEHNRPCDQTFVFFQEQ